nr:MAG TPA: hypothetical protein [Caudoviricetes sp.]
MQRIHKALPLFGDFAKVIKFIIIWKIILLT